MDEVVRQLNKDPSATPLVYLLPEQHGANNQTQQIPSQQHGQAAELQNPPQPQQVSSRFSVQKVEPAPQEEQPTQVPAVQPVSAPPTASVHPPTDM